MLEGKLHKSIRLMAGTVLAALLSVGVGEVQAASKKIGWNVKHAGLLMDAAAEINGSFTYDGSQKLHVSLSGLNLTYYRQYDDRFIEDIDFLLAANRTHAFIAFKGTHNDANDDMNEDVKPVKWGTGEAARVHVGWRRAANKAYKEEIRTFLTRHARGKKILVTGHSMGGALAAYTAKNIQDDGSFYRFPLRLVTFGAPRYTNDSRFFRLGDKVDFWVFTVELAKKNKCVDDVVYSWQLALMRDKSPWRLTAPQNKKGDKVWHGRCETNKTSYEDVHAWTSHRALSRSNSCKHIKLRTDCKMTKPAAGWARN